MYKNHLVIIIIFYVFSLFWRLGDYPLFMEEPRRALISIEMLKSGDFLQPTIAGEPYYRKPPLYNWLMIVVFKVSGGTSPFAVRLISVFSLLLISVLTYFISLRLFNKDIAILAMLFMSFSADIYFYFSRLAEIDLFYSLLAFPVILLPYIDLRYNKNYLTFIITPLLASLAFLAKGIPAIAFLGISVLTAMVLTKTFDVKNMLRFCFSGIIFLLPIGFYLWLFETNEGSITNLAQELFKQSANRVASEKSISNYFIHFFSFPFITAKVLLPFSLLFVLLLKERLNITVRHLLILFMTNFLIYWLSVGAKERYIYALIPILCLIAAYLFWNYKEYFYLHNNKISIILTSISCVIVFIIMGLYFIQPFEFEIGNLHLIIFVLSSTILIAFGYKKKFIFGFFALLIIVRLGINTILPSGQSYDGFRAFQEAEKGKKLGILLKDEKVYYNFQAERCYTFLYALNREVNQTIVRDLSYDDKDNYYIIPENIFTEEKFISYDKWEFGIDKFRLTKLK